MQKRLGATQALAGADLAVARGEAVGLVGPNGAGKTTLLHVLAGLHEPDQGEVVLSLGNVSGAPSRAAVRARVGFAPQPTAVYDELTIEENLAFFARMQGVPKSAMVPAVERAIAFGALEKHARERAGTRSGGVRRRLHVACAVVHAPSLLLLDEPTVGIDSESRAHLLAGITGLRDRGCTVLWSSHDEAELAAVCHRLIRFAEGRVLRSEDVPRPYDLRRSRS